MVPLSGFLRKGLRVKRRPLIRVFVPSTVLGGVVVFVRVCSGRGKDVFILVLLLREVLVCFRTVGRLARHYVSGCFVTSRLCAFLD